MEEEIRKEFMELLRLLDEGKLQEFKDKATECPPVDIAEGLEEIEDEGARAARVPHAAQGHLFRRVFLHDQRAAAAHRRKRDQRRTQSAGGRHVHG